ncbi:hypothetical protein [Pseudomonas sp. KU43P]|uniref:hypothetical protein n=1 Tax=Pseudomonas sp. KU43P TaxID=2487887 RepID=UPI002953A1AA|nr:hypothetical protein [Pseudomonas sp. KU43P]
MLKSLFIEYLSAEIPDYVDFRKEISVLKHKKSIALLRWPNGKPCSLLNLWLFDIATRSTGQSLRQYSSNVSFFIRYCYAHNINFTDTTDAILYSLAKELTNQRDPRHPDSYKRDNNRVRAIISTVIELLKWLESNTRLKGEQALIGTPEANAKVTITKATNPVNGKTYYVHPSMPPEVSEQGDKNAMPDSFIDAIDNQISRNRLAAITEEHLVQARFTSAEKFRAQQEYLYSRRIFMTWCMKTTGLRPGELVAIPITPLLNISATRDLQIPTLKRRVEPPPIRHFRINVTGCRQVNRYLRAREDFIQSLASAGSHPAHQNSIFFTQDGAPLSSASMAKDFRRLADSAGLGDEKVCLSMFRHRFITMEILIHIRELVDSKKPSIEALSEALIKTICERIRKKIGHGSPKSMWHYFDAAFDLLEIWDSIDDALEHISALDNINDEIKRLKHVMLRDGASEEQTSLVASLQEQIDAIRAKRGRKP